MTLPNIEFVKTPNGNFLVFGTDTIIPRCLKALADSSCICAGSPLSL